MVTQKQKGFQVLTQTWLPSRPKVWLDPKAETETERFKIKKFNKSKNHRFREVTRRKSEWKTVTRMLAKQQSTQEN